MSDRLRKRLKVFFLLLGLRLLVYTLLIGGLVLYYQYATRLTPPNVSDMSALKWERRQIDTNFYAVKQNWLRKSETGLWELYLEGAPFERGAASGNLCRELLYSQEVAFVDRLKEMVPDEDFITVLNYMIPWFNRHLDKYVPEEYELEVYGESFFGPKEFEYIGRNYDRMLNYHAAHDVGHALLNANLVGCTSFSVKDSATTDGQLLIGRNFDFNMGDAFARDKIVLFVHPDSGYNHAFVTWPGFMGAVSGMNDQGLTVTLNAAPSGIPGSAKTPISILAREILQYASTIDEAIAIAKKRKTFVAELILIGSANDHRSAIIEKSPSDLQVFMQEGERLVCSNHYQSAPLQTQNEKQFERTSTAYRYQRITQLLDRNERLNPLLAAAILRDRMGIDEEDLGMGNENAMNQLAAHHGVIFLPEEKKIWISCNPYQLGAFICYDLDSVFAQARTIPDTRLEVYDKPHSIPADTFLLTREYENWERYKQKAQQLTLLLQGKPGPVFTADSLRQMIALNPLYYQGYALAGEYLLQQKQYADGLEYLGVALEKNIPLNTERKKLEQRLQWAKKKLNE